MASIALRILDSALEEALTGLTAEDAIMITRYFVTADRTGAQFFKLLHILLPRRLLL